MKKVTTIKVQSPHQSTFLSEINKIASKYVVKLSTTEEKSKNSSSYTFEIEGADSKEVYRTYNGINMYVEGLTFAERKSEIVDAKMTLKVGCLLRSTVMSEIKNYAFQKGIKLVVEEDKNWLISNYRLKMTGQLHQVKVFSNKILSYAERVNQD